MHYVHYGRAHNCVTGESQTVLAWLGMQLIYLVYNVSEEKHISAHNVVTWILYSNKTPCRRSLRLHGIGEWAAESPMAMRRCCLLGNCVLCRLFRWRLLKGNWGLKFRFYIWKYSPWLKQKVIFFFDTCNAVAAREDRKPKYWRLWRHNVKLNPRWRRPSH